MLSEITGIKLKGRKYSNETDFLFWEKQKTKDVRLSLLYGRNGSGKSTISEAFNCIKEKDKLDFDNLDLISSGPVNEEDKKCIHVFNERFIDTKIKIEEDGLNSIVMFGGQIDVDKQIKERENKKSSVDKNLENQRILVDEYNNSHIDKSPQYYFEKCLSILRQNNGWANVDSMLRDKRQNTQVSQTTVKEIINNYSSDKSYSELKQLFQEKKTLFDSITKDSLEITNTESLLTYEGFDTKVKKLLAKKIEQVELTERERKIFSFIEKNGQDLLSKAKSFFSRDNIDFCPYCYQSISKEYKAQLMKEFQKVFNKEVDDYQGELEKLKLKEVNINIEAYSQLDKATVQSVNIELNNFNNTINVFNSIIENRKNNVFQDFDQSNYTINIEEAVIPLNKSIELLENRKTEFNNLIKSKNSLRKELLELNTQIANIQISEYFNKYKVQIEVKESAITILTQIEKESEDLKQELASLEEQKKSIKIAQEHINFLLQYVFFTKGKLSIATHDGIYEIKSNGNSVKPKQISCGERNILALCYYFTELFSDKEKQSIYSDPNLLIIDDPVSSFDKENRVGVLSLLKYELQHFISGNEDTKVLIMTHDLMAFYDIEKIASEITKDKHFSYSLVEFSQKEIQPFLFHKSNEYSKLLFSIYDFSNSENVFEDKELSIGNEIRRVLEAYSTFVYKIGIDEISYNQKVLATLKTEKEQNYFDNLMYRIVLNGESHFEEHVKSLEDFCSGISYNEKKRTAKDVLCFLYLLNPVHIQMHFNGNQEAVDHIMQWSKAISDY